MQVICLEKHRKIHLLKIKFAEIMQCHAKLKSGKIILYEFPIVRMFQQNRNNLNLEDYL